MPWAMIVRPFGQSPAQRHTLQVSVSNPAAWSEPALTLWDECAWPAKPRCKEPWRTFTSRSRVDDSSPPTPSTAAPRMSLLSASTSTFMKPWFHFSIARPTLDIRYFPMSALRPTCAPRFGHPARPAEDRCKVVAVMRSLTLRGSLSRRLAATIS